ncbi:MAG: SDR family NAD(P)-dependent oxidoreductase [Zetaproteobacteria bacterium]|nr:MAG: SDR family NAD(P)-dependent oxidoreductase [Zetaproteobacteria bacterium]
MSARVVITGASGGFGRAFAKRLAARGYELILHGRNEAQLEQLRSVLPRAQAHRLLCADLSTEAGADALICALRDEALVGLVNNAGFGLWGHFADLPANRQCAMLYLDLIAPVRLAHALLPSLIAQQGFLINVSSLAGEYPLPLMSGYAAAKAGLTFWSEALRTELAGKLRVVTLAPGPSPTGFRDVSGMPRSTGSFFRTPPECIIDAALRCLDRGGGYCVPGWRHRLLWLLQKTVPRPIGLSILSRHMAAER